jgi:hypothetical protein
MPATAEMKDHVYKILDLVGSSEKAPTMPFQWRVEINRGHGASPWKPPAPPRRAPDSRLGYVVFELTNRISTRHISRLMPDWAKRHFAWTHSHEPKEDHRTQ